MMMTIGSMSIPILRFAVPDMSFFKSIDCSISKHPREKTATAARTRTGRIRNIEFSFRCARRIYGLATNANVARDTFA